MISYFYDIIYDVSMIPVTDLDFTIPSLSIHFSKLNTFLMMNSVAEDPSLV